MGERGEEGRDKTVQYKNVNAKVDFRGDTPT